MYGVASAAGSANGTDRFAVVHDITSGTSDRYETSQAGLETFAAKQTASRSQAKKPTLLFLRGFASSQWLRTVGDIYGASAELYRRHLDYPTFTNTPSNRNFYLSPRIPSSSVRVFQLAVPTICIRSQGSESSSKPELLVNERREGKLAMGQYFNHLSTGAQTSSSVVRGFHILGKTELLLEQMVTIEIRASPGPGPKSGPGPEPGWHAIVWMDSGRDLSQSVPGPWTPLPEKHRWETYFLPVIVDHSAAEAISPASAMHRSSSAGTEERHGLHLEASAGPSQQGAARARLSCSPRPSESASVRGGVGGGSGGAPWTADQNICMLPFQYGSRLDGELASRDALYALSELFHFSASATDQMLNFLDDKIRHELSFIGGAEEDHTGHGGTAAVRFSAASLLNLNYIKALLNSHTQKFAEVVHILQNRDVLAWPRDDASTIAARTGALLLADFEYLLKRSENLATACDQGVRNLAESANLEEARRSTELSMVVHRLTIIGTIFIPLSFVCSLWGMNFQELGTGSLHMYWWPVSAAPFVVFSYLVYRWEDLKDFWRPVLQMVGRFCREIWETIRNIVSCASL